MSDAVLEQRSLPVGGIGRIGVGWWGAICFIVTESSLFGYLLFAYLYCAVTGGSHWLPADGPSIRYALPATLVLIASSGAIYWMERGLEKNMQLQIRSGLLIALFCGFGFIFLQLTEWQTGTASLRADAYGSMFFTITGMHLLHLIAGMFTLLMVLLWSALGYFDAERNTPVLIAAAYWHFVVVIGIAVFIVLYIVPHLFISEGRI
jgi:heme/copper-type cytochrome/quinol oxidase subunit 3